MQPRILPTRSVDNDSATQGQRACPRCGASFACGIAAGESRCWCFNLPNVIPLPSIDGEGCLCPDCLRAAIEDNWPTGE